MDYIKEYKSFINSHYLSQGVRTTVGIALPALVLSFFHLLPEGIVISLGAMAVSMTDNPGPVRHRRNGMVAASGIVFFVVLSTNLVSNLPFALGILLSVYCFVFSMIAVYGNRESSIGIAALLVLVLSIAHPAQKWENLWNALLVLGGGVWYTGLSLAIYSFRPYKLTQQALGDCMQATAAYLRTKAAFYELHPDFEKNYGRLLEQQADLHQKQDLIRELLFRSRNLVKDFTPQGRILVMIFLDLVDLFETVMTSHQDYQILHQSFDEYEILHRYRALILMLSNELEEMGLAVQSGRPSIETPDLATGFKELEEYFNEFRDKNRNAWNVDGFIGLRQILESIHDIADRLHTLHSYTSFDHKLGEDLTAKIELEQFINKQERGFQLLIENCNLNSQIFRHAIRVSAATLAGYSISKFLPVGHSYWILLTIIVILKPAYSLSKKRNYERLFGTIGGALIGIGVLFFFKNNTLLLIFMIVFMIGAYSFLRTRYLIGVLFMTPYVLLLFHLLSPQGFQNIVTDRLVDTAIGSAIAFMANLFIMPTWEHEQMLDYLISILKENKNYFRETAGSFSGKRPDVTQYKLSRKNAFVSLANLSEAFNRMLSEPKSKQKNIRDLNQFVVLSHTLTAHIATLSYYGKKESPVDQLGDYIPVIREVEQQLTNCLSALHHQPTAKETGGTKEAIRNLQTGVNELMEERKSELRKGVTESQTRKKLSLRKPVVDQFTFIVRIVDDLEKLSDTLADGSII
jgi:uncharacterized membrane protein (TIGR01666 family)